MSILVREEITLMSKCLATVFLILIIAVTTYAATFWFGIPEVLNKWYLAAIPSIVIGVLTCLFIRLNKFMWIEIESCSRLIYVIVWFGIIVLFLAVLQNKYASLVVYMLGFMFPISFMYCIRKLPQMNYTDAVIYGWHGGVGAYALVCLTSFLLGYAGIKLPIEEANFLNHYLTSKFILTILQPEVIATTLPTIPLLLFTYAAIVEEIMFRLPLIYFKEFGMYNMSFLISFIFVYLHVLTRINLPPIDLYQVITSIAIANAVFIAIFTRTLNPIAPIISHVLYNTFVVMQIPCWLALTLLFISGIITIMYYKLVKK